MFKIFGPLLLVVTLMLVGWEGNKGLPVGLRLAWCCYRATSTGGGGGSESSGRMGAPFSSSSFGLTRGRWCGILRPPNA